MTTQKPTNDELIAQYGFLSGWEKNHKVRIHIDETLRLRGSGPMVSVMSAEGDETLYLVICLDPASPIGQFMGRYCVPFAPDPDFHLDKANLWIYPFGESQIRIEVHIPAPRRFADQGEQVIEMVYGVQVKAEDCCYLQKK